jgi:hypothetical protein
MTVAAQLPLVCQDHNRHTCIAFEFTKEHVRYVHSEEGVTDVKKLSRHEFERQWSEIPGYPLLRAAKLYLNPLTTAIEITQNARAALNRIIHNSPEEASAMSTIEASTTEGQQNVNATVAAGLKTGTKGTKTARKPKAPKASLTKPVQTKENTVATKTASKKAKTAKPATKGGAAKLAKGKAAKSAKPAKKAAGKRNTKGLTPFASKQDQKIKVAPDANARSGAMKELVEFVRSKKTCTRADAIAHMVKKDKEEGAEQRARNNLSWGLRHDIFVEA